MFGLDVLSSNQMDAVQRLGYTEIPALIYAQTRTPLCVCKRKDGLLIRSAGVDIAKRLTPGIWHVRPCSDPRVFVCRATCEIERILKQCGYVYASTHIRTQWSTWVLSC